MYVNEMADGLVGGATAVHVPERGSCDKKDKSCECCINLISELSEVKL